MWLGRPQQKALRANLALPWCMMDSSTAPKPACAVVVTDFPETARHANATFP